MSKGSTLLETVVYVGLLAFVLAFVFASALGMHRASVDARSSRDLNNSAVAVLDRMVRVARDANSVNLANSTLAASPGVLALESAYATGGEGIISFYTNNSSLYMQDGTASALPLIASSVSVDSLYFYHIVTSNGEGVRVIMQLSIPASRFDISRTYYATAVLRESYQ
jgi:type II secretory pathway pseudopilin PulG